MADLEKSVVSEEDFTGLQLDTRPSRHDTGYQHGPESPQLYSPTSAYSGTLTYQSSSSWKRSSRDAPMNIGSDAALKEVLYQPQIIKRDISPSPFQNGFQPQNSAPKRICGLRKIYAVLLSLFLIIAIIVAAVLGGVLGSMREHSSASPPPPATTSSATTPVQSQAPSPSTINSELPQHYVMAASAIAPLAFPSGDQDKYSLFFQDAHGNASFSYKNGLYSAWQPAKAIFTDAVNGTALAAINYTNGSTTQSTLFYVDYPNLKILDKRVDSTGLWELGPLANLDVTVSGNSSLTGDGGFNTFRLAAVYSESFATGPGARIYFHQYNSTTAWVQELIWTQANDTWSYGSQIPGPAADSHLCAVLESQSQALRLFYSDEQNAVREIWWNITSPTPEYQEGITLPGLLLHPSADFSVLNLQGSNYLYYSTTLAPDSNVTIRELPIPLLPDTNVTNMTSTNVAQPALQAQDTGGKNASAFVPLAAVASSAQDSITVFWTEDLKDPRSGYGSLMSAYRATSGSWETQNVMGVNLGADTG